MPILRVGFQNNKIPGYLLESKGGRSYKIVKEDLESHKMKLINSLISLMLKFDSDGLSIDTISKLILECSWIFW